MCATLFGVAGGRLVLTMAVLNRARINPYALVRQMAGVILCAAAGLGVGALAVNDRKYALLLLGALVLLTILARSPVMLGVLALAATFNTSRLSVGHGIALPDLMLLASMFLSFPALARMRTPPGLSALRRWFLVYLGAMVVATVAHPRSTGFIEIGHRTMLVVGAAGVGAWIYAEGKAQLALRIFYGLALVFAILAIAVGAFHGFHGPAQPLHLNKNYLGSILGMALLTGIAGADEIRIPGVLRSYSLLVVGGGLAATQSRLSMLGLGAGAIVWAIRSRPHLARNGRSRRRVSKLGMVVVAGVVALAAVSIESQLSHKKATKNTNSVAVRTLTENATRNYWRQSPIIGNGVYYYYNNPALLAENRYLTAPDNSIDEALAEGGLVLAAAFILFHLGALGVLFRSRSTLAVLGLALVADRILHGMGDIYWTAGNSSLPWIVAGMGLAQSAGLRRGEGRQPDDPESPLSHSARDPEPSTGILPQ